MYYFTFFVHSQLELDPKNTFSVILLFEIMFLLYSNIFIVEKSSFYIRFKHIYWSWEMIKNSYIFFDRSYNQNFCNSFFSISEYFYVLATPEQMKYLLISIDFQYLLIYI